MQNPNAITISAPSIPTMAEVESLKEICKVAAYSGFLSSTAKRDDMAARVADAFFVVMYGRELGIPAMTALKTIYVVEGKPSCSGEALLSLMRRAGVQVDVPDPAQVWKEKSATVRVRRPGGEWKSFTYTEEMATKAGLWGKNVWAKYWGQMLIWRAVSMASKFECSDITGGLYTIEELAPLTALDADGAPLGNIITPARQDAANERPPQLAAPEKSTEGVSSGESSAKVSGAGLPSLKPVGNFDDEFPPFGIESEQGEPDMIQQHPQTDDDPPNLYRCDRLIVSKSRTATQFFLAFVGSTNGIPVLDVTPLVDLELDGTKVPALGVGSHSLSPSWSVYAEREPSGKWVIDNIVTAIPV